MELITTTKPSIQLSDEQEFAIEFVLDNRHTRLLAISGPAGSGKTTLIKELEKNFTDMTVSAMTNKAKAVLKQKGISASTLHEACLIPKFRAPLDKLQNYLASENENLETAESIAESLSIDVDVVTGARETYKDKGVYSAFRELGIKDAFKYLDGWSARRYAGGTLLVDEASMLGPSELQLAQQVFDQVVLVGDENQLPPIKGERVFWEVPDRFTLTQIHRQAKGSQPLQYAQILMNRVMPQPSHTMPVDLELSRQGCPVIVWKNATRVALTMKIREGLGLAGQAPQVGEVLICRNTQDKKMRSRGFYNNSMWKVVAVHAPFFVDLQNDAGDILEREFIRIEEMDLGFDVPFRFAYALTCHSAQGSEWEKVMIHWPDAQGFAAMCRKTSSEDIWAWLYTAVTRARQEVIWVGNR